jgi:hypothetical protein
MIWAGHVARMGAMRNTYKISVWKPEGKRPFGRNRRRWEYNIKMNLREIGFGGVDWDRWRALVNTVTNHRFPYRRVISWLAERSLLLASQEGLCSMELVSYGVSGLAHRLVFRTEHKVSKIGCVYVVVWKDEEYLLTWVCYKELTSVTGPCRSFVL